MSVEQCDVIDFVARSPKGNEVLLAMVEVRDPNVTPEALQQLNAKFLTYTQYILSGALAKQRPDLGSSALSIQLHHFAPMTETTAEVLRQWAGRLVGVNVSVCSRRLYWNPIRNFLGGLARRFLGQDRGLVRWPAAPAGVAAPLLAPAQFAEEFTAAFREVMPNAEVERVGDLELRIGLPDGTKNHGSLHNAYNNYLLSPERKDEVIRKMAISLRDTPAMMNEAIDKSCIVPILKDRAWVEEVKRSSSSLVGASEKEASNVHEIYNEELVIVYAQDTPTNIRYLTAEDFAALNLDMKGLRTLAIANLRKLVAEPDIQPEDGLYRIRAGGDYDACILVLEDFWTQANLPVDGELIAAVPARDSIFVTGSNDSERVGRLKQIAQRVASQASYRLTPKLFVRRDGGFVVYEG